MENVRIQEFQLFFSENSLNSSHLHYLLKFFKVRGKFFEFINEMRQLNDGESLNKCYKLERHRLKKRFLNKKIDFIFYDFGKFKYHTFYLTSIILLLLN